MLAFRALGMLLNVKLIYSEECLGPNDREVIYEIPANPLKSDGVVLFQYKDPLSPKENVLRKKLMNEIKIKSENLDKAEKAMFLARLLKSKAQKELNSAFDKASQFELSRKKLLSIPVNFKPDNTSKHLIQRLDQHKTESCDLKISEDCSSVK